VLYILENVYWKALVVPFLSQSTQRKFVVYVEGHLISMNFPPRNWGGKLCLLIGVKTLSLLLRSKAYTSGSK